MSLITHRQTIVFIHINQKHRNMNGVVLPMILHQSFQPESLNLRSKNKVPGMVMNNSTTMYCKCRSVYLFLLLRVCVVIAFDPLLSVSWLTLKPHSDLTVTVSTIAHVCEASMFHKL